MFRGLSLVVGCLIRRNGLIDLIVCLRVELEVSLGVANWIGFLLFGLLFLDFFAVGPLETFLCGVQSFFSNFPMGYIIPGIFILYALLVLFVVLLLLHSIFYMFSSDTLKYIIQFIDWILLLNCDCITLR